MVKASVKPKEEEKQPDLVPVFISHKGIEAYPEKYEDEKGRIRVRYTVKGSVNGDDFKILCNQQVMVKPEVAEALKGIIKKQQELID